MLPNVGCNTMRQLLDIVEDAKSLFEMPHGELRKLFGAHDDIIEAIEKKSMFPEVENEVKFIEKNHIKVLYYTDPQYPQRLNRTDCVDTPIILYVLGDADMNPKRAVSVVGTRKATPQGIELTQRLVDGFRGEGITVVSGLALGIDAASHDAAIRGGMPTIGVLAHGLNQLYPPQNRGLAKRMLASGGALITEMRSSVEIHPGMFPIRNRIIAAMSDATVVVEASKKGGALITANLANGYHRDLFAFPGRVDDKYSEGCNAIIASCKAMLIRDSDDVFTNMAWPRITKKEAVQASIFPDLDGDEKKVYDILVEHPMTAMEEIRDLCDLPLPKVATALLSLELKNLCRCHPGKIYKAM